MYELQKSIKETSNPEREESPVSIDARSRSPSVTALTQHRSDEAQKQRFARDTRKSFGFDHDD